MSIYHLMMQNFIREERNMKSERERLQQYNDNVFKRLEESEKENATRKEKENER